MRGFFDLWVKCDTTLFKMNGARILNEDIEVSGKIRHWTVGNYLQLLKKAPSNVKLGVGKILEDTSSDSSSDKGNYTV